MQRLAAALGTLAFLTLAPGSVAGLIPWWITGWRVRPALLGAEPMRWLGLALILAGLLMLLEAFARFAWQGLGTPAPIYPTRTLVTSGQYRHVRNPMYVAVTALVLGQGLWFGDPGLLAYGGLLWLSFFAFVLLYEEPKLLRTYGEQYRAYRDAVPRWIPRLIPWRG